MISDPSHIIDEVLRAEEQFRLVVESSPAAMVIVDQAGCITRVNRQVENWFGYDRSELLGQTVEVLIPDRLREQHVRHRTQFLAAPQTRPMGTGRDLFARRKDSSEFPVDVSLHPMKTTGGEMVMAHIVDLTDRIQADIEIRKRHAVERLALLGQLAGGVAHEIRNPLGVIRNAAYYLEMVQDSLDTEAQQSVMEIQREVDRANHIVNDLLDYAREPRENISTFDLVGLVRAVGRTQRDLHGAEIQFNISAESVLVAADSEQIERILVNLIRNAVQASEGTGRLTITLRRDGDQVITDVADEGSGINQKDRARLFEPLFTTKAKGIGLGLAVSKRYAERNGGQLEVVDGTTSGATFRLTLPIVQTH